MTLHAPFSKRLTQVLLPVALAALFGASTSAFAAVDADAAQALELLTQALGTPSPS